MPSSFYWGDICKGSCPADPNFNISNLSFITGIDVPHPPVDIYSFGDACESKSYDYCDGSWTADGHGQQATHQPSPPRMLPADARHEPNPPDDSLELSLIIMISPSNIKNSTS